MTLVPILDAGGANEGRHAGELAVDECAEREVAARRIAEASRDGFDREFEMLLDAFSEGERIPLKGFEPQIPPGLSVDVC
jgi:hypothetical protein